MVFIFWEPLPSGFVKVNFNDSFNDARGGAWFMIQDLDARLLAVGGLSLIETFVPCAELQAT